MQVAEKSKFYKIKLLWHRIRHGLFLFTLRNALTRIGLDIEPYYWYKEIKNGAEKPKIRDSFKDYELCYLGLEEIWIMNNIMGLTTKELEQNLIMGQKCIGLKRGKEIAGLLFVDLNLATYLRYHCFELLENYSVEELYSIVSYFNTSSIKVNKKLNAQKMKLYLYIGLLKRYHWNFLLRDYSK